MTRNVPPPDNIVDQIWYDIRNGRIEGDILVTQEQIDEANEEMLQDGAMFLGRRVRLTTGEPSSKYPPDIPNEEQIVGGLRFEK